MENQLLNYYKKYNISPERQNIENLSVHFEKRKKLYRQCGIPEIAFRNADILEVGPGGGYNTLAFFHWGCKHADLVEANPQGVRDMQDLFAKQHIPVDRYHIFECLIENYNTNQKYDIIVAEGFLPIIDNQEEVIVKLQSLLNERGIIVITCVDKIGVFVERIKRLIGILLTQDIMVYEDKVKYLTGIFEPQLKKLRGVSKLPEDWVKDNMLNPAVHVGKEFTLSHAIQFFESDFDILGSSPHMFTDYSWSKDIWYDYKKDYLGQFNKKRLSFLLANMPEVILPVDEANILINYFKDMTDLEAEYEKTFEADKLNEIIKLMRSADELIDRNLEEGFIKVFREIKEILLYLYKGDNIEMENYPHFFAAFGRTQQYISFVKK